MKYSSYCPRSGRAQKLNAIYQLYAKRLGRWAMSCFALSQEDLEDALQETFRNVAEHLDDLGDPADRKTYAYLCVVLKNNILDLYRRQKRIQETCTDEDPETISSAEDSPEDILIRRIDAQELCDLIRKLPDVHKEVLLLRYFCDLSYRQISDALKISENLVAIRLHRAKEYLRRAMLQREGED